MRKYLLLVGISILFSSTALAQITNQILISKNANTNGNATSHCASLSGDARYNLFESYASNLVNADNNARSDLFLYDNQNSSLQLISKNKAGVVQQGGENPTTCSSAISRDGSTIIYASDGLGLVEGPQTNVSRLYSFNVANQEVELLTPGAIEDGVFFPSVSQDGSRVVFVSSDKNVHRQANGLFQIYMLDRQSNNLKMLSIDEQGLAGNGQSIRGEISHDGKWAVYLTKSTNLKGSSFVNERDKFQAVLVNLESGQHQLLSKTAAGLVGDGDCYGADISDDGTKVIFYSEANNLVFPNKKRSGNADVLLFDQALGALELVSVDSDGKRISGSHEILGNALSADGNLIMFRSLVGSFDKFRIEVYVRDRKNSRTYLSSFSNSCSLSTESGDSHSGAIAPDAAVLAFAVGKDTKRSALQLVQVGLDVLKSVSSAPQSLDALDADICGNSATLAMTPFTVISNFNFAKTLRSNSPAVTYQTKLSRTDLKKEVARYTSKKNILSLKNLSPGNYSASYRVEVKGASGTSRSKFSKNTKFKVG